jgi:rSAM/selenodomain-associated transferase 2
VPRIFYDLAYHSAKTLLVLPWRLVTQESTVRSPLPLSTVNEQSRITVVIPTYNEESSIASTIQSALQDPNIEVVLGDGGSTDRTVTIAQELGARIVRASSGRADCQNAAAAIASGEVLLFLHADTLLPPGYGAQVRAALKPNNVVLGAFSFKLTPRLPFLSLVEWGTNRRSRRAQLPYGDQALFLRKDVFAHLGHFPKQPFMEDYDFVREARHHGAVTTLDMPVVTSSRRWQMHGVFGNTMFNQLLIFGRAVGVPLEDMVKWYYSSKGGRKDY